MLLSYLKASKFITVNPVPQKSGKECVFPQDEGSGLLQNGDF
jgi:hypothetical protein